MWHLLITVLSFSELARTYETNSECKNSKSTSSAISPLYFQMGFSFMRYRNIKLCYIIAKCHENPHTIANSIRVIGFTLARYLSCEIRINTRTTHTHIEQLALFKIHFPQMNATTHTNSTIWVEIARHLDDLW